MWQQQQQASSSSQSINQQLVSGCALGDMDGIFHLKKFQTWKFYVIFNFPISLQSIHNSSSHPPPPLPIFFTTKNNRSPQAAPVCPLHLACGVLRNDLRSSRSRWIRPHRRNSRSNRQKRRESIRRRTAPIDCRCPFGRHNPATSIISDRLRTRCSCRYFAQFFFCF